MTLDGIGIGAIAAVAELAKENATAKLDAAAMRERAR
jgi:hypothetical protein